MSNIFVFLSCASGLCAACMLVRVEQERLESLKYERATIYIKCVEDNEDTKMENDCEVRGGMKIDSSRIERRKLRACR